MKVPEGHGSRYMFLADETRELLKAIYSMNQIKRVDVSKSVRDQLYRTLEEGLSRSFLFHHSIKKLIAQEWKDTESVLVFSSRRLPFSKDAEKLSSKAPTVSSLVAKTSKCSDLSF